MSTFESFKASFKGDIITPDDDPKVYEAAIDRWAHNAARRAKIVTYPKDTEDIVNALKYVQTTQLPLAVKGGGHSAAGQSSSEGGFIIDLARYFGGARIDKEKRLAYVGGGAIWETVDHAAIKEGFATVGGTVNHTGVGGLILGGGYGWLSSEHGLTLDNLVEATIVTASGEVVTTNETTNPDLYFGIRGGGGNFGIAAEFAIRLFPQSPTVFAGPLAFPIAALDSVATVAEEWRKTVSIKESIMVGFKSGENAKKPFIVVILFYNGTEEEGRRRFKAFYDLEPFMDMAKTIPYENLNTLLNPGVAHGMSTYFCDCPVSGIRLPAFRATLTRFLELLHLDPSASAPGLDPTLMIELRANQKINSIPKGTMAFNSRGPQYNTIIVLRWNPTTPVGTEDPYHSLVRGFAKSLATTLSQGEEKIGDDENAIYGNYDSDPSSLDKTARLYGSNYPRLQALKKKYDPNIIFNKWHIIQPAA